MKCSKCKNIANSSNKYLCKDCKKKDDRKYYLKNKEKLIKKYYKETEGKVKRRKKWNDCPTTKSFYLNHYIKLNKTPNQISNEFGVSPRAVFNMIKKFNMQKDKKQINVGIINGIWKGDKVKYEGLHNWVRRHKPSTDKCESCNKKTNQLDAANISGKYKRDIKDYKWLCRSCHMNQDNRINNLKQFKNK